MSKQHNSNATKQVTDEEDDFDSKSFHLTPTNNHSGR